MLVLVPIAAPVHATNSSPLQYAFESGAGSPLAGNDYDNYLAITITNPASNAYAVTAVTLAFSMPGFTASSWDVYFCYPSDVTPAFLTCSASGANTASWTGGTGASGIPPGTSFTIYLELDTPSDNPSTVFPITATMSSTVQDASSAAYYTGPSQGIQVISEDSDISYVLTPGGSNTATQFTAGTAPYSLTATVTCTETDEGCPASGIESGVQMFFAVYNETSSEFQTQGLTTTSGNTSPTGTLSTTVTPSNHEGDEEYVQSSFGSGGVVGGDINQYSDWFGDNYQTSSAFTTIPAAPASVGFSLSGGAFPTVDYLTTMGTTTNMNAASNTFTGAELNVGSTAVGISVTDRFNNPISYGPGGVTFVGAQAIAVQTASGGLFDIPLLPSTITCGVTAGFTLPSRVETRWQNHSTTTRALHMEPLE